MIQFYSSEQRVMLFFFSVMPNKAPVWDWTLCTFLHQSILLLMHAQSAVFLYASFSQAIIEIMQWNKLYNFHEISVNWCSLHAFYMRFNECYYMPHTYIILYWLSKTLFISSRFLCLHFINVSIVNYGLHLESSTAYCSCITTIFYNHFPALCTRFTESQ